MIKVTVFAEEYFPVFELRLATDHDESNDVIEISNELYKRWKLAYEEFVDVEERLMELIEPGKKLGWA